MRDSHGKTFVVVKPHLLRRFPVAKLVNITLEDAGVLFGLDLTVYYAIVGK